MCKIPVAPHKMSIFTILLSLITCARGETRTMYVVEGDSTQLNFRFPCDSAEVTLRHGHGAPFYNSLNAGSVSLPENQVLTFQNGSNSCSLILKISPVLRSNEGGYILTSYDNDRNFLEDTRIGLRVDHPPGMASCEWSAENIVDDWGILLCEAPAGSTPGLIACYQNGIRLPPRNTPTNTGNILQQAIWVRYSEVAFCCASLQEVLVDRCACKDFVWDLLHIRNIIDPCAAHLQDSTPTKSPTENNETNFLAITTLSPTTLQIPKKPTTKKGYISPYWPVSLIVGTLIFICIIQCVVLSAAFRKIRQIMEKGQQNGPYVSVPTAEVQL